ncbi:MAG: energy transducer TonB [Gemmatimonadales bacterium]
MRAAVIAELGAAVLVTLPMDLAAIQEIGDSTILFAADAEFIVVHETPAAPRLFALPVGTAVRVTDFDPRTVQYEIDFNGMPGWVAALDLQGFAAAHELPPEVPMGLWVAIASATGSGVTVTNEFAAEMGLYWPNGKVGWVIGYDGVNLAYRITDGGDSVWVSQYHARTPPAAEEIAESLAPGTGDYPPTRLFCPNPRYPEALRRAGIRGRVTARFVIDAAGVPDTNDSFEVVSATHPRLVAPAKVATAQCRFRPGIVRGRRVRAQVQQDFRFDRRPN